MKKNKKKDFYSLCETLPGDKVKLPPDYWEKKFEKLCNTIAKGLPKKKSQKKSDDYPCKKCKKECKSLHPCVKVLKWLLYGKY